MSGYINQLEISKYKFNMVNKVNIKLENDTSSYTPSSDYVKQLIAKTHKVKQEVKVLKNDLVNDYLALHNFQPLPLIEDKSALGGKEDNFSLMYKKKKDKRLKYGLNSIYHDMEVNNPDRYKALNEINNSAYYTLKKKEYKKFFSANKFSPLFANRRPIS